MRDLGAPCSCGAPAVVECPVCGPECAACFMAGAGADGVGGSWPAERPKRFAGGVETGER
jgi:hypothetical protein